MDMSATPGLDAAAPDWLGQGPTGRGERRLAMLEHLAGVGARLADAFAEQAFTAANTAWIEPDCHIDPGIPFVAMLRAVRQTLALQARFEKEERLAATEAARRDPARRDPARHTRRRRLIKGAVTEAIKDTADPSDAERLFRDLEERLHDAEADESFDDGPASRVVANICKALGVSIDLSLFDDEDVQPGPCNGDAHQRPAQQATSPSSPARPPVTKPDASKPVAPKPDAAKRDMPKPAATRPPDAYALGGLPIPGIPRPREPSPLEKYLGPPRPPQIPRWPR